MQQIEKKQFNRFDLLFGICVQNRKYFGCRGRKFDSVLTLALF